MERVTQPACRARLKALIVLDTYVYFASTEKGKWEWVSKRTASRMFEEQCNGIK